MDKKPSPLRPILPALHRRLPALLRPIARFCIGRGIKFQDFQEAAKLAFTCEAEEALQREHESVNISRLSVVTGLQRKDIKRLQSNPPEEGEATLLAKILGQWQGDRRFSTARGKPRVLSIEGAESEFSQLVAAVSKDLKPHTVLFELERIQAVHRSERGIKLLDGALSVTDDVLGGLEFLTEDISDLFHSVEENLFQHLTVPHLHIRTVYDNICVSALPKIRLWILENGSAFHEAARNYISQFDKDLNPKLFHEEGGARVSVGSVSFSSLSGKRLPPTPEK
ncbi:DUF6502 family protein [bacterium]|nr:DUF6502 family protein [bacterium]